MLSIVRQKYGISINDIFFAPDPKRAEQSSPVSYFIQAATPRAGFYPFKTQIIDLSCEEGNLFASLSSNTRYKIRRADREGTVTSLSDNPTPEEVSAFGDFFDEFARQKHQPPSNRAKLGALCSQRALLLSYARDSHEKLLVAHAYVADYASERLRLLYSASHFRGETDTEERNRIGRANRSLHWNELLGAKHRGFTRYDLGGIPIDQRDPEKNAIARFKAEFGGEHVTEYNGYTSSYPLVQHLIPTLRRFLP